MTHEDKQELKEILHNYIEGVIAQQDAKFDIIDYKLDAIKEQTTKTNGRVTKLEESNMSHIINCPVAPKVRALEDNQLTNKAIKKWVAASIGITGIVVSIGFALFKIITEVLTKS